MSKHTFDSCKTIEECKKCDLGYIIRKYIHPLMQTLTNDVKEYYMRLLTTKCLNTSIMLSIFMLGRKRGIEIGDYCDTEETRKRHKNNEETNQTILNAFIKNILEPKCTRRILYYILLTDGKFSKGDSSEFFPGHVFILEKYPNKDDLPYYYLYQSYINEYDLNDYIKKNNKTLKINYKKAKYIFEGLDYILNVDFWDQKCVDIWKVLTFVDSSNLIGSKSKGEIFLCIRKAYVRDCLKHIEDYTKLKIKDMEKSNTMNNLKIYGDKSLYANDITPMTNKKIYSALKKLEEDIKIKKSGIK